MILGNRCRICSKGIEYKVYDEVITIENDDAFEEGRTFARSEGILVGISSGAALKAADISCQETYLKIKERLLLHFFRIQVTDIFQQHYSAQLSNQA